MFGSRAQVIDWHGGAGRVRVARRALARPRTRRIWQPGQEVRVVAIDGLTLEVEAHG